MNLDGSLNRGSKPQLVLSCFSSRPCAKQAADIDTEEEVGCGLGVGNTPCQLFTLIQT